MRRLILLIAILLSFVAQDSYAGWLTGWSNRLQINVNANNNEDLSNYQIKVNIQGTTPAGLLYTDFSLIKLAGADIRFTSSDGTTLLDYWIYNWDDSALTGDMVVEVPTITSPNVNFTIYMYYNNNSASAVSNYTNTMSKKQIDVEDLAILHSDDGSGTVVNDSTTNNNDFTLSNSAAWVSGELVTNPIAGYNVSPGGGYNLTLSSASIWSGCVPDFGAAYDAQQATLLDVVPASGYVEFQMQFDFAFPSGYAAGFRWFNKNNDETASLIDLIDIYMNKADGTMRALKYNNNTLVQLTSTTTSWTAGVWYTVKVSWGTGGFKLFINGSQQASNADTTSWSNGTARDLIFGAYNYGGTISNRADGKMKDMVIYNLTTSSTIASYPSDQYPCSGTVIEDLLSTAISDNKFTTGSHLNFAGTYNMTSPTLLDVVPENFEIAMRIKPNSTINNTLAVNQVLFSKFNLYVKPLYANALYYGQATGKTLLDTFPTKGYIEFSFNSDTTHQSGSSVKTLLAKINDETGGSRDSFEVYLNSDGKLRVDTLKNGATSSLSSTQASWTAGTWYLIRVGFGVDGMYLVINGVVTNAENLNIDIPTSGTVRPFIVGAKNLAGSITQIFDGQIGTFTVYDVTTDTILADYRLTDGGGTTLTDSSGNVQHLTLSSASMWGTADLAEGIQGYFVSGNGGLRFQIFRRFQTSSITTQQTSWFQGGWYSIRFAAGAEGMFIYVNGNMLNNGKADYSVRHTFNNGTSDDFCFGAQLFNGVYGYYFDGAVDELYIASTHYSPMRSSAFYEFRKIVKDPFIYYGTVISNSNITWGSDKRDFYEPNIFWDGTKYQMVFDCTPRSLTSLDTCLATSTDGRIWTDYASNPIIQGYTRPYIFSDEMGVPIKMGTPAKYWVYVVDDGVPTPAPGGGTVFHRFSCTDFDAGCADDGQVLAIGTSGQWDDKYLGNNTTWKEGTNYYMMYDAMGVSTGNWWEGYATSSDGMSWTKYASNPVIKGWASNGSAGSMSIHKINGVYYAYDLETPTSTTLPSDLTYLTSTNRINWTHVLNKTPVLQRNSWRNNDQYGDANLVQRPTETLLYVDEIPYNADVISTLALFYAPNKTIGQVMLPEPTLSSSEQNYFPIQILNIWWDRQRKREYSEGDKR